MLLIPGATGSAYNLKKLVERLAAHYMIIAYAIAESVGSDFPGRSAWAISLELDQYSGWALQARSGGSGGRLPEFSDYIVFADESGDHGMESINPQFPVFSLVFCILRKDVYAREVEPAVREFKFRWFGHDAVILHEREIRKQLHPFSFLKGDPQIRERFFEELTELMSKVNMFGYVSVIDKEKHRLRYADPWNPYEIAMHFCMERLCNRLLVERQKGRTVHVLFESRGKSEDRDLELEFRRIASNQAHWGWRKVDFTRLGLEPVFVSKAANLAGHQITDLIARPFALQALRPEQTNRAVEAVRSRIYDFKVFP